ncbi:NADH dehydrogenase [ubiquinone] 1 beta subcomplex subunit 5 mitochondrial [Paragonimus heterotremus]|uniref:NADH dehydrogenase [ubiquinone] 1 beta subcomplex subunit 5, mitochondrial n=1 Tax=Paragonimus heterotremus TaxID=100268 RepID=A0A8J4SZP3_9TREM|nr:NADH dehydrogenase [ubiquinone] 1 beta subcomplex subunit 5 mitochondrial [Paragonimus heterotremus]
MLLAACKFVRIFPRLCGTVVQCNSLHSVGRPLKLLVPLPLRLCTDTLRFSSTKVMVTKPSEFLNKKFIDAAHFFIMLGVVPCLVLVFCVNLFVGPAELTDIPEGYEPRFWEYHKHPISRFIAKHFSPHPQMIYESTLGHLDNMREQKELIQEERWFRESQRTHGDYRGWYFIPANPAGVNRGRRELELDQEMGELISR